MTLAVDWAVKPQHKQNKKKQINAPTGISQNRIQSETTSWRYSLFYSILYCEILNTTSLSHDGKPSKIQNDGASVLHRGRTNHLITGDVWIIRLMLKRRISGLFVCKQLIGRNNGLTNLRLWTDNPYSAMRNHFQQNFDAPRSRVNSHLFFFQDLFFNYFW